MKIVIIGDGKVGYKLAKQLSVENYDVVMIDSNEKKLKYAVDRLDIACVIGDAADAEVQRQADVPHADLVIACTSADECNMLSCLIARRLGARHTIARVRNPIYYKQIGLLKEDLHLSMAVNPELIVADEISRLLLFPDASKIETFARGRVELIEYLIQKESKLAGMSLADMYDKFQIKLLVCAVEHCGDVLIPDGDYEIREGDRLHIAVSHSEMERFFRMFGKHKGKIRKVIICGGGHDLLIEEGIEEADAFVGLTGMDEENIITALFAKSQGASKIIAKINEDRRASMVEDFGIDSIVSAKTATADSILSYVRARKNSQGSSNVETLYQLVDDKIEALEFIIKSETRYTGIPLKDLTLRSNNLIACISRKRQIIIPGGDDSMEVGDSVIVVTMDTHIEDLEDILV